MTSPKTKPVVTEADEIDALARRIVRAQSEFHHNDTAGLLNAAVCELLPVFKQLATTRTEAHAAGYAECQRDVVEWARGSMSDRHTSANWDAKDTALDELAEGVEAGEHVGAAKEVERG
jgi:hypothetical protein